MQEQEKVLQQCVRQLECSEAAREALVFLLKEAIQDQEAKLETLRCQLQIARSQINEVGILSPKVSSHDRGVQATPVGGFTELPMVGESSKADVQATSSLQFPPSQPIGNLQIPVSATAVDAITEPPLTRELSRPGVQTTSSLQISPSQPIGNLQIPLHQVPQPPSQPATSFASLAVTDEESKKAAAAAVAAKLAASTSSAQMLTSILSSLVAEEAASMNDSSRKPGFSTFLPMFSPDKRQRLEPPPFGADVGNPTSGSSPYFTPLHQPISSKPVVRTSIQASMGPPPPPPPPPPPLLPTNSAPNQFIQSAGMMLSMPPFGFGGNRLPPPPPLPSHLAMGHAQPPTAQSPQPLHPPQQPSQQQNASGGYYRPPGIDLYGSSSQPSTQPVQRQ